MAQILEIPAAKDTSYIKRVISLVEAGELDKAYKILDGILVNDPDDPQALTLAANVIKKSDRAAIAYSLAKRAAQLKPERPEVWNELGHCAQLLWRMDEARECYKKAAQRSSTKAHEATAAFNLGSVLLDTGQFKKAEKPCREALEQKPDDTNARHNLGLSLLAQRKWREGWELYASSVGTKQRNKVKYRPPGNEEPIWDGTKGQTVVVYGEQGLGDEVCAASILPDVIGDSKRVIVDCDHRLAGLFKRSFPQATVYGTRWAKADSGIRWDEKPEDIDASIAGFEVAKFYRNDDSDFPGTPYLTPCPTRSQMWRAHFTDGKPVIGIAWSGGTFLNAGLHRQLPLSEWSPIFSAIDAHWVSLQYKDASQEIAGTKVQQFPFATLTNDYDDTAALVARCNLVIAVQTSVVHLAGSLGVPCWSLIPKTSQWRYGEEHETLPWYQSVRMYRQRNDKWPVTEIVNDLKSKFPKS